MRLGTGITTALFGLFAHPEWFTPNPDVWSAAVLQAKNEEDGIGLRECIRPLLD